MVVAAFFHVGSVYLAGGCLVQKTVIGRKAILTSDVVAKECCLPTAVI
jgi:hypothetical protein